MPRQLQIHHIGVVVDDLDEAITFYTDILGAEVGEITDLGPKAGRVAFAQCGAVQVELIDYAPGERRRDRLGDQEAVIEHIAFHVDSADDAYAELAAKGVGFAGPPNSWHDRRTFFTTSQTCDGVMYQFREPIEPGSTDEQSQHE